MCPSTETVELDALIQISSIINTRLDLDHVLEAIMSVTTDAMEAAASCLFLIDDETDELVFHVPLGRTASKISAMRRKKSQGIVGSVIESGRGEIVNDVTEDPRFFKEIDQQSGFTTRSILCTPLRTMDRLLGAIQVLNKLDGSGFSAQDLNLCNAIAGLSAIAIENAALHQRVVQTERLAAIGETIAGLAHCVRNVLNGIQGGSYMIDLGFSQDDVARIRRGWEIVSKNNSFLQDLVLDMLAYSKDREPEYELVDIHDFFASVTDLMELRAKERGVRISWTRNRSLKEIVLDPKGIQRCLLNLISNAIDACAGGEAGRVEISTGRIGGGLFYICVADNGCGIREENRGKLFQPFFSTKGSRGTGLGLAVTKNIVTQHGGEIEVESEVDRGTRFLLKLPLREKLSQSGATQSRREHGG